MTIYAVMLVSVVSTAAACWLLGRARNNVAAHESSRAAESRARLEEIRYALDQAAIVATTDQRGIITHANDKFCEYDVRLAIFRAAEPADRVPLQDFGTLRRRQFLNQHVRVEARKRGA